MHSVSDHSARRLATVFMVTTIALTVALVGTWVYIQRLTLTLPVPEAPEIEQPPGGISNPISPLLVQYRLDLPGRGELFPAMADTVDAVPLAILTLSNSADQPVLQVLTAEVKNWSERLEQTLVVGPRETRTIRVMPRLLPRAYDTTEIQKVSLSVLVVEPTTGVMFADTRPVLLHSASDIHWGKQFANAQVVARWVTPHDPSVLRLVAGARRFAPKGRMAGYNISTRNVRYLDDQVRTQAKAVYSALQRSGFSYVSSIFTFGAFVGQAQRIRLPHETLTLSTANCMDVSVAFASAMENLGLQPVIVIVPGHAFTGVRLGPKSDEILYLDLTVLPDGSFDQAMARAQGWLKKTPVDKRLIVDISAARVLGIYPLPVGSAEFRAAQPTGAAASERAAAEDATR